MILFFQIPLAQTQLADKLLDQLFSSPPALIVFFVMIVAIVSIPVQAWENAKTLRQLQKDWGQTMTQLTGVIDTMTNTVKNTQMFANTAQEENSDNYLMIRTYFDQQQGIIEAIRSNAQTVQTVLQATQQSLAAHVVDVTSLHAQTRHELANNLTNRLSEAIELVISQRRLELFDTFSTPPDDDCRYELKIIRTAGELTHAEILLYKAPIFRDGNEAGKLRGSGIVVYIILDTAFPGWCYVREAFGETPQAGYARTRTINIMDLPETADKPDKGVSDVQ